MDYFSAFAFLPAHPIKQALDINIEGVASFFMKELADKEVNNLKMIR